MNLKRITLFAVFAWAVLLSAWPCTNLIVGKNASADGSTIVSYSAALMACLANCITIRQVCTRKVR